MNICNLNTFPLLRSSIDSRDHVYRIEGLPIQEKVDLREWDSLVEDQSSLGSCTGQSTTNAYELLLKKLYPSQFVNLSSLFVYYNGRLIENNIDYDTGASLRDILKGMNHYGVCKDSLWPYDIDKFNVKPSQESYDDAINRLVKEYHRIYHYNIVVNAINEANPIIIGLDIFSDFIKLNKEHPTVPMPQDTLYLGAHSMVLIGYDLRNEVYLAKNSFGTDWGDNGYCYIPFEYADEYIFEYWVITIPNFNESTQGE